MAALSSTSPANTSKPSSLTNFSTAPTSAPDLSRHPDPISPLNQVDSWEAGNHAASVIQQAFRKKLDCQRSVKRGNQLLKNGDLQGADWAFRRGGAFTAATGVRRQIEAILKDAPIENESVIEEGQTVLQTRKVTLKNRVKGVLKFGHLWPANWRHEVAAYKMDQLLGLDMVPVTVARSAHSSSINTLRNVGWFFLGSVGKVLGAPVTYSNQYFIENALTASAHPLRPGRENDMRFFDFLIANSDRHRKNFLISTDPDTEESQIAIDHGLSFGASYGTKLEYSARAVIPRKQVYERLKWMSKTRFERMLSPWLTKEELAQTWKRREHLVERIEDHLSTNGVPTNW